MVVLFKDGFILLMYKSLGQKEIVNKLHQSCPSPFNVLETKHQEFWYEQLREEVEEHLSKVHSDELPDEE